MTKNTICAIIEKLGLFLLQTIVHSHKELIDLNLNDLYDHEIGVSTSIRTELSISDLFIIASEFRKYVKYRYKISTATTFAAKEDATTTCKFWADEVFRREHKIDPRIYQDNFKRSANLLIADFEEVILALAEDEDVINSKGKDIHKPTIKKAMRKYLPDLKILDARKARKKASKDRKELARTRNAVQQNAWSLDEA